MAFLRLYAKRPAYTLLKGDDGYHESSRSPLRTAVFIFVLVLLSFISGMQFHLLTPPTLRPKANFPEFTDSPELFRYNRSFTERPSESTDAAWHSLFPRQGGYFRHPQIAPSRSAFAVFHQLHCLDAIRHGYWATFDAVAAGEKKTEADFPFMSSPPHIRHCIDLIRQALICQPDLTIEVKDETKGGVTGFGIEHQCVNWQNLVGWVGEWERYGQDAQTETEIAEADSHSHSH